MGQGIRCGAALLTAAVLVSACGSRLSDDQVAQFAGQAIRGPVPGSVVQTPDDDGTDGPGVVDSGPGDGPEAGPGDDPGTVTAGNGPDPGGQDPVAGPQQPGQDNPQQVRDTRSAPPGGNGGATDVGVTDTEIVVYNVADLTGAVPGLFRDTVLATQAFLAYFAATEGTVYGRQIRLVSRDTGLSTNGNRSAYLDACKQAFAAVGSMSAFEEGARDPIENCSTGPFPDLRNVRTSQALQGVSTSFGAKALRTGEAQLSEWEYYRDNHPEAIRDAGYVFLENTTTIYQAQQNMAGTRQIGYEWKAEIRVATAETNYARIVNELKTKEIRLVAFIGAYQQAERLVGAMIQQGYRPDALALQTNNYTPDLLQLCAGKCDDFVIVSHISALMEEIDRSPELQLYAEWLNRVSPGARPSGLGVYSWGAARLFVEALKEIGPDLTRAKLIDHLRSVDAFDSNGLFPPQNVGSQQATDCIVMLDIVDNQFVRIDPAEGYRCRPRPATL